jgi:hypothetical protein
MIQICRYGIDLTLPDTVAGWGFAGRGVRGKGVIIGGAADRGVGDRDVGDRGVFSTGPAGRVVSRRGLIKNIIKNIKSMYFQSTDSVDTRFK